MYFYFLILVVKNITYVLICFTIFSCINKEQNNKKLIEKTSLMSIAKEHVLKENIQPMFLNKVENWQELKNINSFLKKFDKASPNEILSNALELRDLVKGLKDSVKPRVFDIPSFNARINILNNETLRLADLTFIPAIQAEEVNSQVDKITYAFSAVNAKINTILTKKRFEEAIDINLDFIGIDSTKIDSVSKKSIDQRKKEAQLNKRISREGPPVIKYPKKKKKNK